MQSTSVSQYLSLVGAIVKLSYISELCLVCCVTLFVLCAKENSQSRRTGTKFLEQLRNSLKLAQKAAFDWSKEFVSLI
jgi:hypothetical protein